MAQGCKQCQGKTLAGVRCKNKISCDERCTKYCHLHSSTYAKKNTSCTTPYRRRQTGAVKKSVAAKKAASKKSRK